MIERPISTAAGHGDAEASNAILAAAYGLFLRHGLVQVTLAAVAEKAGVPEQLVVRLFRSKDGLLAAALRVQTELTFVRLGPVAEALPADPVAAVEKLFEAFVEFASRPALGGGGDARVALGLPGVPGGNDHPGAHRHRIVLEVRLADQLAKRGVASSSLCARQLVGLMEDAIASMFIHGDRSSMREAGAKARRLLQGPASD